MNPNERQPIPKFRELVAERPDDAPTMVAEEPGTPIHDAKRDPAAAVRYGEPGLPLVQSIAELDLAAAAWLDADGNGDPHVVVLARGAWCDAAPTVRALCARTLELIDLLEATRASLDEILTQRGEIKTALRAVDATIEQEVPQAIRDIDAALSPLELEVPS